MRLRLSVKDVGIQGDGGLRIEDKGGVQIRMSALLGAKIQVF